ncbi:MAG: polymer-forming cytoskeletal protein [Candidatus Bipolaricaulia bacterium]
MNEERQRKGSATISGAGKLTGGVYEQVKIAGAGRVEGDLEADTVIVSGAGKIEGSVKAKELRTSGSCRVSGDVEAQSFKMAGAGHVEGKVRANQFKSSGSQKIGRDLKGEQIHIAGSFNVGGDVEADQFQAKGAFRIAGLLNADRIEIDLGGHSSVREIGGSKITVRRGAFGSLFPWGRGSGRLKVESIEGDEIHLEATRAQIVRGNRVTVGEGCEIETVEYSESLKVDTAATVRNRAKVGEVEE